MSKKKSVAGRPGYSPVLPRVPITINGTEYFLQFSFNALAEFERLTGVNSFEIVDFSELNATKIRAMLYAAMLTDCPEITIEDVGNILIHSDVEGVYKALMYAWTGSRPILDAKDVEENPPVVDESVSE